MALSQDEKETLRQLLKALFGNAADGNVINPTEETLQLTEQYILKLDQCNTAIRKLLRSLPTSIIGKGFLKKVLKHMLKLVTRNLHEFRACSSVGQISLMRYRIFQSTW